MSYKQHLLHCIRTEIETCKYLYSRIVPGTLDFRPRDGMRSIGELLRYLTWSPVAVLSSSVRPDAMPDHRAWYAERAQHTDISRFPSLMDEQWNEICELMGPLTDDDLLTRVVEFPWPATGALGEALMETTVKWLAAYKMHLFTTIKMAGGNDDLNTVDCWMRPYMDPRVEPQEAAQA